jgi:hypothetical protein
MGSGACERSAASAGPMACYALQRTGCQAKISASRLSTIVATTIMPVEKCITLLSFPSFANANYVGSSWLRVHQRTHILPQVSALAIDCSAPSRIFIFLQPNLGILKEPRSRETIWDVLT